MYKFVVIQGSCGNPYDISKSESQANKMYQQGYDMVQVYQTTASGCFNTKSILVMVFKEREEKVTS
jgi:hypothetical protein